MDSEEAFGKVLLAARKQCGLSQEALAADAEVQRNYISLLEKGGNSPTLRMLFKLCAVLGVPPSEMLTRVEELIQKNSREEHPKKAGKGPRTR